MDKIGPQAVVGLGEESATRLRTLRLRTEAAEAIRARLEAEAEERAAKERTQASLNVLARFQEEMSGIKAAEVEFTRESTESETRREAALLAAGNSKQAESQATAKAVASRAQMGRERALRQAAEHRALETELATHDLLQIVSQAEHQTELITVRLNSAELSRGALDEEATRAKQSEEATIQAVGEMQVAALEHHAKGVEADRVAECAIEAATSAAMAASEADRRRADSDRSARVSDSERLEAEAVARAAKGREADAATATALAAHRAEVSARLEAEAWESEAAATLAAEAARREVERATASHDHHHQLVAAAKAQTVADTEARLQAEAAAATALSQARTDRASCSDSLFRAALADGRTGLTTEATIAVTEEASRAKLSASEAQGLIEPLRRGVVESDSATETALGDCMAAIEGTLSAELEASQSRTAATERGSEVDTSHNATLLAQQEASYADSLLPGIEAAVLAATSEIQRARAGQADAELSSRLFERELRAGSEAGQMA